MNIKKLKKAKQRVAAAKSGTMRGKLAHLFHEAVTMHQGGRFQEAEQRYRSFLAQIPDHHEAWNNLGVILHSRGNLAEAFHCYTQALRHHPDHHEAMINLSVALKELGHLDEAVGYLRKVLTANPNDTNALNNLGIVLKDLGDLEEASQCHEKGLMLKPNDKEVLNNLGVIRREQYRLDEAETLLRKALAINPRYPEALNNLAITLKERDRPFEALDASRQALEIMPSLIDVYNIKAAILIDICRVDEAILAFRNLIERKPGNPKPHSAMLFILNYVPTLTQKDLYFESTEWWRLNCENIIPLTPAAITTVPGRRLRIGYVSPDFRLHAVSFFFRPLLTSHHRDRFEIFCYAEIPKPDKITEKMQAQADHWYSTMGRSDREVAEQIRSDGIDILVDLAGHSGRNRLPVFAYRPAPVQVTWLGYPNTTGMRAIDYRFSDTITDPEGEAGDDAYYSEKLVRLPRSFFCYGPPEEAPAVGALPADDKGHITFGSLNNLLKVNNAVVDTWARVLTSLPTARLIFAAKPLMHEPIREQLRRMFSDRGIDPERITMHGFLGLPEYLTLHQEIDIALDTWPHNGHTVTCHALWMGVPVITLRGSRHAARMGASVLTQVGLAELIASSPEDYVEAAQSLAQDLPRLREIRASLRDRVLAAPMSDHDTFASEIETLYDKISQAAGIA